jgi:hypothetical protein
LANFANLVQCSIWLVFEILCMLSRHYIKGQSKILCERGVKAKEPCVGFCISTSSTELIPFSVSLIPLNYQLNQLNWLELVISLFVSIYFYQIDIFFKNKIK